MNDALIIFGTVSTIMTIVVIVMAYHMWQQERRLDRLEDSIRGIGLRVGSPVSELPPARPVLDEYAPDAIIDDTSAETGWHLPRGWR